MSKPKPLPPMIESWRARVYIPGEIVGHKVTSARDGLYALCDVNHMGSIMRERLADPGYFTEEVRHFAQTLLDSNPRRYVDVVMDGDMWAVKPDI